MFRLPIRDVGAREKIREDPAVCRARARAAGVEGVDGIHHARGAVHRIRPVREQSAIQERGPCRRPWERVAEIVDERPEICVQVLAITRLEVRTKGIFGEPTAIRMRASGRGGEGKT